MTNDVLRNSYSISNLSVNDAMRLKLNPEIKITHIGNRTHRAEPYAYQLETNLDSGGMQDVILACDYPAQIILKRL